MTMVNGFVLWGFSVILILSFYSITSAAGANGAKEMYLQYCGSCHGSDGRGNGPVSRDLKIKVPDLTGLAKKNNGVYPLDDVMASIDGRRAMRTHGDRNMPIWGEKFRSDAEGKKYPELTTLLKAKTIAEYIGTLQK